MIADDTILDSRVVSVTADGLAQRENIPDLVVFSKFKKKIFQFFNALDDPNFKWQNITKKQYNHNLVWSITEKCHITTKKATKTLNKSPISKWFVSVHGGNYTWTIRNTYSCNGKTYTTTGNFWSAWRRMEFHCKSARKKIKLIENNNHFARIC